MFLQCQVTLTIYKADTSLRRTARAGPEGVRFRESSTVFEIDATSSHTKLYIQQIKCQNYVLHYLQYFIKYLKCKLFLERFHGGHIDTFSNKRKRLTYFPAKEIHFIVWEHQYGRRDVM